MSDTVAIEVVMDIALRIVDVTDQAKSGGAKELYGWVCKSVRVKTEAARASRLWKIDFRQQRAVADTSEQT